MGGVDDDDGRMPVWDTEFQEFKRIFNRHCPLLKNVHFMNSPVDGLSKRYDLFTFERYLLYMDTETPPISNDDEFDFNRGVVASYLRGGAEQRLYVEEYPFTFQMLSRYQPRKLYIETTCCSLSLSLNCMHRIINCRSIKSVKFGFHSTPYCFLEHSLSNSSGIQSLRVEVPRGIANSKSTSKLCSSSSGTVVDGEIGMKKIFELLSQNTILRRLVFKDLDKEYYDGLFQSLMTNKTTMRIKALGLRTDGYRDDGTQVTVSDLQRLKEMPNIRILYCHCSQLPVYLDHVKENRNIKILKCIFDHEYRYGEDFQNFIDLVQHFIQYRQQQSERGSSLEKLVFNIYDDFDENHFHNILQYNSNFNNNNQLNIIVKKDDNFSIYYIK
eukprot:gene9700-11908_t